MKTIKCAVVEARIVKNIILWPEGKPLTIGVVRIPDGVPVDIGYIYRAGIIPKQMFVPPPTPMQEMIRQAEVAVEDYVDVTAQNLGYNSIVTAVGYADEPAVPKFQAEGRKLRAWRSLVWAKCYEILNDVVTKKRKAPTIAQLLKELPTLDLS